MKIGFVGLKVKTEIILGPESNYCQLILWIEPDLIFQLEIIVGWKKWQSESTEKELKIRSPQGKQQRSFISDGAIERESQIGSTNSCPVFHLVLIPVNKCEIQY